MLFLGSSNRASGPPGQDAAASASVEYDRLMAWPYTYKWEQERLRYLRRDPLCADCLRRGIFKQAEVVDHIIPHKNDQALFWDRGNWQSLCKPCHDRHKQRQEIHGYSTEIGVNGWPVDPDHPANKK